MSTPLIVLNDGNKIPALGLGESVSITPGESTLTTERRTYLRIGRDFCGPAFGFCRYLAIRV